MAHVISSRATNLFLREDFSQRAASLQLELVPSRPLYRRCEEQTLSSEDAISSCLCPLSHSLSR